MNSNWWSVDHHERLTCHCRRVEEADVVVHVVVASETEARGGREELLKLRSAAVLVAAASVTGEEG